MYDRKLLDRILDRDNLNQAYKQVRRNKGAAGVDGMTIEELGAYMALNKKEIISQIRQRTYQPQPVLRVEILLIVIFNDGVFGNEIDVG